MTSEADLKEELQELQATFNYYKQDSKRCMDQCRKLLEQAGRSEADAESLRPRINELEVNLAIERAFLRDNT